MSMSLRSRLALLLVAAIVGVVALAACVSVVLLEGPDRDSFNQAFAEEVRIVAAVLEDDPGAAERLGITVEAAPPARAESELVVYGPRGIGRMLREAGIERPVRIVGDPRTGARRIAFEIEQGRWAYLPYPAFPPRDWPGFVFALIVVVVGAAIVSLYAATKITRPLTMLDRAIGTLGPDGLPAPLAEAGPAEVRATAAALNRLTARVREAVESRMRMVAAAGHDMRTPMTRMRLRAEFAPDEERELWLKDLAELDRIADSAIRLVREEADAARFEATDLTDLVQEMTDELADIGLPVAVTQRPDTPLQVGARPFALKRALRNLVENAATHGGGAEIALTRDRWAAAIAITDRGPGIPEESLEQVFEPFFRVDPARRQSVPGAGLGLAIAKEIVDQHGGSVTVSNRSGGGLLQRVELPLVPDEA